ncbi:hypothetical protein Bca52824_043864 [Brassica carinata]|uniref:Uncharacterized protein n=1 Tax=Brassica carinata TaxID=52824 RepID=A0A8X7UYR3_BRACI|nr:hypothetical protein Bca52824_043864 [Brassica carinata]
MGGIRKKELVTIGDLHTYLSNSDAQEADFLYKARIVGVLQQNGWAYVSCTGCSKKLDKYGTSCVSPMSMSKSFV